MCDRQPVFAVTTQYCVYWNRSATFGAPLCLLSHSSSASWAKPMALTAGGSGPFGFDCDDYFRRSDGMVFQKRSRSSISKQLRIGTTTILAQCGRLNFHAFTSPQSIVRMSDVFPMGIASCVWHSNDREAMLFVTRKNSNDKSVDN